MVQVTPEAHQRLLTHMRKQKVRASNHAAKRIAAREGEEGAGAEAAEPRHAEFESLLEDDEDDDDDDDEGGGADGGDGGGGGAGAAAARGGVRKAKRINRARLGLSETWQDRGEGGEVVDLLEAPLVEPRRADGGGGARRATGKRGRDEAAGADGVSVDAASGKLVVREDGDSAARPSGSGGFAGGGEGMEVDAEDEILRVGEANVRMTKRRRGLAQQVVPASAAEEAEAGGARRSLSDLKKKRARGGGGGEDHFGAQLGEQYSSKRGAGDVKREGAPNPFAYLPLNPRMLGKRQQRNVKTTLSKFAGKKQMANASSAKAGGKRHVHGIEQRRRKAGAGGGARKPSR